MLSPLFSKLQRQLSTSRLSSLVCHFLHLLAPAYLSRLFDGIIHGHTGHLASPHTYDAPVPFHQLAPVLRIHSLLMCAS